MSLVEMGFNRVYVSYKHSILVLCFALLFLLITLLGQTWYDWTVVYPSSLVWFGKDVANYNAWSNLMMSVMIFVVGSVAFHAGFAYLH